jgi:hypothetical protein
MLKIVKIIHKNVKFLTLKTLKISNLVCSLLNNPRIYLKR